MKELEKELMGRKFDLKDLQIKNTELERKIDVKLSLLDHFSVKEAAGK